MKLSKTGFVFYVFPYNVIKHYFTVISSEKGDEVGDLE